MSPQEGPRLLHLQELQDVNQSQSRPSKSAGDMTLRLSLAKNDPLQTTFSCPERAIHYASDTVTLNQPFCGSKATTTVRKNVVGKSLHVGIIEWPANPNDRPAVVVGSRTIEMIKTGLYTS
jgi:hypothetical protein